MPHGRHPVAWPVALSMAAHVLLGAALWRQAAPPPQRPTPAARAPAATLWLRLVPAAGPAQAPQTAPVAAAPRPRAKAPAARAQRPLVAAAADAAAAVAPPTATAPPAESPAAAVAIAEPAPLVVGVAIGPPRTGSYWAAAGGRGWVPRAERPAAPAAAVPPPPAAPQLAVARDRQVLDALVRQVAAWSVPADAASLRCRLDVGATAGTTGPDSFAQGVSPATCDPPAWAERLAAPLAALREGWAAYRLLAPDAPESIVVAYAGGRYELRPGAP